jgi:hypothetical protein
MTLLEPVIAFEWRYQTRQLIFAAALIAMAGFALVLVSTGFGPESANINSPYVVTESLGILGLVAIFVVTFFVANAALRDVEHRMSELIFATPLTTAEWFVGRFLGVVAAASTIMLMACVVLMLAPLVLNVDPARLGEVHLLAYLWPLLVIAIPNLLLVGAVLFVAAALSRSTVVTYLAGVALWIIFWVTALLVDSPLMAGSAPPSADALARAALLDPFGLSAFFEQTRYWTPSARDTELVALSGHLLGNRLLWLAVTAVILILGHRQMGRRLVTPRVPTLRPRVTPVAAPRIVVEHGAAASRWSMLAHVTRLEWRSIFGGWAFPALLVIWVFFVAMEVLSEISGGEYGARLLPTTGLIVDRIMTPLQLMGSIVLVYYAAEVVWRDRVHQMHHLLDATPAPAGVRMSGKLLALLTLPLVLLFTALATGAVIQAVTGHPELRLDVLLPLVWYAGAPFLLFGIAAFVLQVVVPNRWVAMLLGIGVAVIALDGASLGITQPMLRYGAFPLAGYSDFDGFGSAPRSFGAFAAWWACIAALLLLAGAGLWRRGTDIGLRVRLRGLAVALGPTGRRLTALTALTALVAIVVGTTLATATAKTSRTMTRAQQQAWSAGYERAYRRFHSLPQPVIVGAAITVRLAPRERVADIDGRLVLRNDSHSRIDTLLLSLPADATGLTVQIDRPAAVRYDSIYRVVTVALDAPLGPRDSAILRYTHRLDRSGIHADVPPRDVTGNGTMLMSSSLVPGLGYRVQAELSEPRERAAAGLAGAATAVPTADSVMRVPPIRDWLTLELTVATDSTQTVIAPGRLVTQWDSAGRRWFRYQTDRPITPLFAVASARYRRHRLTRGGTTIEVWYHPAHGVNVPRIAEAAMRSVEVLSARLGPLPDSLVRVVEVPRWAGFGAFAVTGMVLFPEGRGFLVDEPAGGVDLLLRRTAHEIAHQWWGHRVSPPQSEGSLLLVESLAKDSEQQVVAAVHGTESVDQILAYDEDRYLVGRSNAGRDEPTMERMTGEAWLYYGKGALMMHALRRQLGTQEVDGVLRSLLDTESGPDGGATALLLRDRLLTTARNPGDSIAVREWFSGRATWDVRLDSARSVGGDLLAQLSARHQPDPTAPSRSAPGSLDLVVVILDAEGKELTRVPVALVDGKGVLRTRRPAGAATIVVDPDRLLIDIDRSNNRATVR